MTVLCLALSLVVAACIGGNDTTEDDLTPGAGSGVTSTVSDRVLGTRIQRTPQATPSPASTDAAGDDDTSPAVAETDDPPDNDALVPIVTTVTVPVSAEREVVAADAGPGDNLLSFEWDESTRSVTSGSSSRLFDAGGVSSVVAEQVIGVDSVTTRVVLTNDTADRNVQVDGRLVLEVEGSLSSGARLQSLPIDEVLEPGESVAAEFVYVLPSGSYTAVPSFEL